MDIQACEVSIHHVLKHVDLVLLSLVVWILPVECLIEDDTDGKEIGARINLRLQVAHLFRGAVPQRKRPHCASVGVRDCKPRKRTMPKSITQIFP